MTLRGNNERRRKMQGDQNSVRVGSSSDGWETTHAEKKRKRKDTNTSSTVSSNSNITSELQDRTYYQVDKTNKRSSEFGGKTSDQKDYSRNHPVSRSIDKCDRRNLDGRRKQKKILIVSSDSESEDSEVDYHGQEKRRRQRSQRKRYDDSDSDSDTSDDSSSYDSDSSESDLSTDQEERPGRKDSSSSFTSRKRRNLKDYGNPLIRYSSKSSYIFNGHRVEHFLRTYEKLAVELRTTEREMVRGIASHVKSHLRDAVRDMKGFKRKNWSRLKRNFLFTFAHSDSETSDYNSASESDICDENDEPIPQILPNTTHQRIVTPVIELKLERKHDELKQKYEALSNDNSEPADVSLEEETSYVDTLENKCQATESSNEENQVQISEQENEGKLLKPGSKRSLLFVLTKSILQVLFMREFLLEIEFTNELVNYGFKWSDFPRIGIG
ncbi:hypothetical protein BKA69DRAFT_1108448 [Paraphysoderma sedebokerense]|nr:hypothetical protein BKA69DRAFT_1108448 [Paraphysoderma sedebokerense]